VLDSVVLNREDEIARANRLSEIDKAYSDVLENVNLDLRQSLELQEKKTRNIKIGSYLLLGLSLFLAIN